MARNSADLDRLLNDIAELKEKVGSLIESGSDLAAEGRKATVNATSHVLEGATETVRTVRDTVREHPITSVAGAFAIGYTLAQMLRR